MTKGKFRTDKSGLKYAQILGVKLNITSEGGVLNAIGNFLADKHKFSLITPNPELVVMASRDKKLLAVVNSFDLSVPDGVGLRLAVPNLPIIKGRKLFLALVSLAKKKQWRIFFLGGENIPGVTPGPRLNTAGEVVSGDDCLEKINAARPDLLFVGFGMPKQENWIYKNARKLNVGGIIAVGGTFDYVFGKAKLPPIWLEKAGLEWFWRLMVQPWRLAKIFNAVIVFPLKVFRCKVRRKCA